MGAGRAGAEIEIAADGVLVVVSTMLVSVGVGMVALMSVRVAMSAAIGVAVQMFMRIAVRMLVTMVVRMAMHGPVFVDMGVLMFATLDFHFTRTAAANRTHCLVSSSTYSISISLTRISVPPVGCT
jgi:hypothetical protein